MVIMTGRIKANKFCVRMLKLMNTMLSLPVNAIMIVLSIVVIIRHNKNAQTSNDIF